MALLAAQAAIGALALFAPHPDAAYRAAYLDHTVDCWQPDPAALAAIATADVIHPQALPPAAACALMPKGWNPADQWGVWSNGPAAQLNVPLRPADARLILHLRSYAPNAVQHVAWSQPGGPGGALAIQPGQTAALPIDLHPGQTPLHLTLQIQRVHAPLDTDVDDWRPIGVALIDITRLPAKPQDAQPLTPAQ